MSTQVPKGEEVESTTDEAASSPGKQRRDTAKADRAGQQEKQREAEERAKANEDTVRIKVFLYYTEIK